MTIPPSPSQTDEQSLHPPQRPLRIALFSGNYNNVVDGPVKALNRLVGYLIAQGHQVLVFAPTIENPAIPPTGTLVSVPSKALPGRSEYRLAGGLNGTTDRVINNDPATPVSGTIRSIIEQFKPDLIHLSAPDYLGYSALKFARTQNIPAVASFHTRFDTYLQYYYAGWLRPVLLKYMQYFYNRCEHVYVPSQSMADELTRDNIGRDIRMWTRGVDGLLFSPDKRDMGWRQVNGIADKDIAVLFVGRIVLEKGLDVFARSFEIARNANPDLKAMIVGDGPERSRFEKMLPEDSVFTGYCGGEDLARAYASADIFFNPSITETFGNVTLEAMASGIPTICAKASGSISLIENELTGLLGQPNAEDLGQKLSILAANPVMRREQGANARKKSTQYNWDVILEELVGNYYAALKTYHPNSNLPFSNA